MSHVYFVRHAEPMHGWAEDRTRPLTEEGIVDSKKVTEILLNIHFDYAISSPYQRSMDTIKEAVSMHNLELVTEERFRERQNGESINDYDMIQKRWADFSFHEFGGESIRIVQDRNIEALHEVLRNHENQNIMIGTHGTALASILNYYDSTYNCNDFFRIINFMPYIIRLDFEETNYISKEEILIVEKEYRRNS